MKKQTIDLTPNWSGVLRLYLAIYCEGTTAEAKKAALAELVRMAKMADKYVALVAHHPDMISQLENELPK
jgi:hypothetical protein